MYLLRITQAGLCVCLIYRFKCQPPKLIVQRTRKSSKHSHTFMFLKITLLAMVYFSTPYSSTVLTTILLLSKKNFFTSSAWDHFIMFHTIIQLSLIHIQMCIRDRAYLLLSKPRKKKSDNHHLHNYIVRNLVSDALFNFPAQAYLLLSKPRKKQKIRQSPLTQLHRTKSCIRCLI